MFTIQNTKIGDEIITVDILKDGWSDMHWIVTAIYPFCVLCNNLCEDGKIGNHHRAFDYGFLAMTGKEKCGLL